MNREKKMRLLLSVGVLAVFLFVFIRFGIYFDSW